MLSIWWRVAYWYGFAAQFTALPFHQEYADSGHFTFLDRCSTSLRNNLIFYAVLAVRLNQRSEHCQLAPARCMLCCSCCAPVLLLYQASIHLQVDCAFALPSTMLSGHSWGIMRKLPLALAGLFPGLHLLEQRVCLLPNQQ